MSSRSPTLFATLLLCAIAFASCSGSTVKVDSAARARRPATGAIPWPAPTDPLQRAHDAGLEPERKETLAFHVHAHLDVFVNGRRVRVPAGIGINIKDPGVERGRGPTGIGYGGIKLCDTPCISPLHTHDATGVIHTESRTTRPNRLGQFFMEWGVKLTDSCVGGYCRPATAIQMFVDGKRYQADPNDIPLSDRKEIAIVIGSPPRDVPWSYFK